MQSRHEVVNVRACILQTSAHKIVNTLSQTSVQDDGRRMDTIRGVNAVARTESLSFSRPFPVTVPWARAPNDNFGFCVVEKSRSASSSIKATVLPNVDCGGRREQ